MKLLIINIEHYNLALRAEDVVAVGKPNRLGKIQLINLESLLGLKGRKDDRRPRVTCRLGKKMYEFSVDRILGLEDIAQQDIFPWPPLLGFNKLFQGVARISEALFLILDIGAMADEADRHRK